MPATHGGHDLIWPASRFYWSFIDAPGWNRVGQLPTALRLQLEENVPLSEPVALHAIGIPIRTSAAQQRVLACAIPRADLATVDPSARSLRPAEVPLQIQSTLPSDADPIPLGDLNLLVGDFEPRASRYRRFRRHLRLAACVLAGAILISIGLERRTSHERAAALSSEDARAAWLHEVGLRDERDLTSALLRQRSLLDAASKAPPSRDAAESLAMLINAWPPLDNASPAPADIAIPRSIAVTDTRITITLTIEGDAAAWLRSLAQSFQASQKRDDKAGAGGQTGGVGGWAMSPARLSADGGTTHVTLDFTRPPIPPMSSQRTLPQSGVVQ